MRGSPRRRCAPTPRRLGIRRSSNATCCSRRRRRTDPPRRSSDPRRSSRARPPGFAREPPPWVPTPMRSSASWDSTKPRSDVSASAESSNLAGPGPGRARPTRTSLGLRRSTRLWLAAGAHPGEGEGEARDAVEIQRVIGARNPVRANWIQIQFGLLRNPNRPRSGFGGRGGARAGRGEAPSSRDRARARSCRWQTIPWRSRLPRRIRSRAPAP